VRAFSFHSALIGAALVVTLWGPPSLSGQYPGRIVGYLTDAWTGRALADVTVSVRGTALTARTDAGGVFTLRALPPGPTELVFERVGYRARTRDLRIENGRVHRLSVRLTPDPVALDGLATAVGGRATSVTILDRDAIRRSAASTLGDLLRSRPGVVVRSDRPGGAETISIRGSAAGAVLVLVDGVPLNDPVTGAADLGAVPTEGIREVRILPGARSTVYGSGARAGVVVVETGGASGPWSAHSEGGSLGRLGGGAEGRIAGEGWQLDAGIGAARLDGGFTVELPDEVGGGRVERSNADTRRGSARVGFEREVGTHRFSARLSGEWQDRGLPGKSFAPSPTARSEGRRTRASTGWEWTGRTVRSDFTLYGHRNRTELRDPNPPLGLPYDSRSDVDGVGLRGTLSGAPGRGGVEVWSLNTNLSTQRIRSELLGGAAPERRTDATLGLALQSVGFADGRLRLRAAAAAHRDPTDGGLRATHELGVTWGTGGLELGLQHRSSFSPPALADQFFREGVAAVANPDLQAERVPSELEASVAWLWGARGWSGDLRASAYAGDVRGMIVWAPDFRFFWSPRNLDVLRDGLEAEVSLRRTAGSATLEARAGYALTRARYDREDPVQVIYRPRHTGSAGLSATAGPWRLGIDWLYTGLRYPVAARVNALPAFHTTDLRLGRTLRFGVARLDLQLAVSRLFDSNDTLIFGFPHPGRTIDFTLRVRGTDDR